MKRFTMFACLALALVFAMSSVAGEMPRYTNGDSGMIYGGSTDSAKASRDTVQLIGPAGLSGDFETGWGDWTHYDITQPTLTHWQVSDYQADLLPGGAGNTAAWCGDITIASCDGGVTDLEGGYGNSWNDLLEWRGVVANPAASVSVTFHAWANIDSEPGYDFTNLLLVRAETVENFGSFDGRRAGLEISPTALTVGPGDYHGAGGNEVVIQVQFLSDGAWSDEDCLWPTAGAVQIDDIIVTLNQGGTPVVSETNFDAGYSFATGDWKTVFPVGVGDFAQIWTGLEDIDACFTNYSSQVGFIDDGLIVENVGPSNAIDWAYGPSGYIVNTTGGAAGLDAHLHNAVESPIVGWPGVEFAGVLLEFNAYRHEDLSADSPGMFYTWGIRSGVTEAATALAGWQDRNFVYYGGPDYLRVVNYVTDLMEPGFQYAQVQLACYELGWNWGWDGDDGFPAPYFDSVSLKGFTFYGPAMSARDIDLAQDSFTTIGEFFEGDLSLNDVRFDMAQNIATAAEGIITPGDSIAVDIAAVRSGAVFTEDPKLVYLINPNPLFNPYRTFPNSGEVFGAQAVVNGTVVAGKWVFDLPDEGFLFAGDVLHYFISATDVAGGVVQTSTMPAAANLGDTEPAGFADFSSPLAYSSTFTVHALPTVWETTPGVYSGPETLFWNDFANRGGEAEWYGAFANLGLLAGVDYDIFYTNGPSSGVGNGLGAKSADLHLDRYANMIYTAGDLSVNTIANDDYNNDGSNDIGRVTSWLAAGNKDLLATGDDLVFDLVENAGPAALQFVQTYLGVSLIGQDLRPLIGNQATPTVKAIDGNGVFVDGSTWIAYGGCNVINTFDCVSVYPGAQKLAEFANSTGGFGDYPLYSAATLNTVGTSRIITLPYDFSYIYTPASGAKALPARVSMLESALGFFGVEGDPIQVTPAIPGAEKFAVSNYPNPFNPSTKIAYTMPKAGHLMLKIYNVKGELVKTLIDGQVEKSDFIMWDGTNDSGVRVSSGVYFSEARTGGQVLVNKMALVK